MDIVVTIPKSEAKNTKKEDAFVEELGGDAVQFWSVHRKAKELNVGDRVYFVENGFVTCYHIFLGYVQDMVCEVTDRFWPGLNLLLRCPSVNLKNPVQKRGFQGFHYIERLE